MSKNVECPVCGKSFNNTVISEHVNRCLNAEDSEADKQLLTEPECKKRKNADWSFLSTEKKPEASKTKPEHSKHAINDSKSMSGNVILKSNKTTESESFSGPNKKPTNTKSLPLNNVPLAEKMRPQDFETFVGQEHSVGKESLLLQVLSRGDHTPSLILHGPPGCGKTTFAKILAQKLKSKGNVKFLSMSATTCSVNDVKEVAKIAGNDLKMLHRKTILFLDEIHRFNKSQQDTLLPYVEDGTLTLFGATTENPSFNVNSALLSRCRIITFEKLTIENIKMIVTRALQALNVAIIKPEETTQMEGDNNIKVDAAEINGSPVIKMEEEALDTLAGLVDGDARAALNGLQLSVEGCLASEKDRLSHVVTITSSVVKEALQRSHMLYDKSGEEHYNTVSALIKSMRGSDASAALYWMTRMLEGGENPLFVARRLVIFASEDIGLADTAALNLAVATHQACQFLGMPECSFNLAHCVIYLARAQKSTEVLQALQAARKCVQGHQGALPPVPLHLRNASNKVLKNMGYGKGYKYPPDYSGPIHQSYFPSSMPGPRRPRERAVRPPKGSRCTG